MKKFFTTLFLAVLFLVGYGQEDSECLINFEDNSTCYTDYILIDSISDTNNIWQIGVPQKTIFSSAYSPDYAIITDTINPYPVNDTSVFTIVHITETGFLDQHTAIISGYYKVDCDTLTDFGKIEFSPDKGQTWIDLLNDMVYEQYYMWLIDMSGPQKPIFTGSSNEWHLFYVNLAQLGPLFNIQIGDTILYRFTFISDSIQTNREGLIFDNISTTDYSESISENKFTFSSTLFPNPATNSATIEFENRNNANFGLQVFDVTGRTVIEQNIKTNRTHLNTQNLPPGIYQYRLLSEKERRQSFGKFVVE